MFEENVILNVFLVGVERLLQRGAIWFYFDNGSYWDNSVANGVEFGLLCACDIRCADNCLGFLQDAAQMVRSTA